MNVNDTVRIGKGKVEYTVYGVSGEWVTIASVNTGKVQNVHVLRLVVVKRAEVKRLEDVATNVKSFELDNVKRDSWAKRTVRRIKGKLRSQK